MSFFQRLLFVGILPFLPPLAAQSTAVDSIQTSIQAGNLAEAAARVAEALAAHPDDAGVLNLRGVIHAQRQELPEARTDFERAVALQPALTPAWQNLGRACQMLQETDCAFAAWRRVVASKPADAEAHYSLAVIFQQRRQFADSLRELARVPDDEHVLAMRCIDLVELKRLPEAVQIARKLGSDRAFSESDFQGMTPALDKAPAVVVALGEAVAARGGVGLETQRLMVLAYEQTGRLKDARAMLERVAAADASNPKHLLELARLAYLLHDLDGALGYLGHARDLAPNDAQIHFLFGMVLVELKLPLDARKSLEKALALEPRNPEYNHAMGSVILNARDAASAIPYFQTYVAVRPHDPKGLFALGVAFFAAGEYESCRKEMELARRDPKTETGAAYFLGRVARLDERYDEAAVWQERAIHLSPKFAEAYSELARVRIHQDRMADAKAAIERALSISPESFQANSTLLTIYQRTHDPRAQQQAARLKTLDEERGKTMELLLRSVEVRPYQ